MRRIDAGVAFDLVVVCNGGDERPLTLSPRFDDLRPKVLNRANVGYNIAAWEQGWRSAEGYEFYLFLQDDCFLKWPNWVHDFEFRMCRDKGLGLLGETVVYDRATWDYVRETMYIDFHGPSSTWPEPVHPIDLYRTLFERRSLSWPDTAEHLPSIILFSSRSVLEEVGGFPYFGPSYREAVASELAISRAVVAAGYRISKVKDQPFEHVGHPQWSPRAHVRGDDLVSRLSERWWKFKVLVKDIAGLKRRAPIPMTAGSSAAAPQCPRPRPGVCSGPALHDNRP
jgi:hypothetical protein